MEYAIYLAAAFTAVFLLLAQAAHSQYVIVQPNMTLIQEFAPPRPYVVGASMSYTWFAVNSGTGNVTVTGVGYNCPPGWSCSLSGFLSGDVSEGDSKRVTLSAQSPKKAPITAYQAGITVSYKDAYGFGVTGQRSDSISLDTRGANLRINDVALQNLTTAGGKATVPVNETYNISVNVSNTGNLASTGMGFRWGTEWGFTPVEFSGTIAPSASFRYVFRYTTPGSLGEYNTSFVIDYVYTSFGASVADDVASGNYTLGMASTFKLMPPTKEGDIIGLKGDKAYMNILWNASYVPISDEELGVRCYLNCPYATGEIESLCAPYQNCSYTGFQGTGSCTIMDIAYLYFQGNNVTCRFYNPKYPEMEHKPYPHRTFQPINFMPLVASLRGAVVGSRLPWKISVANKGVLEDSYNISIINGNPSSLRIDPPTISTDNVSYAQTASVYPQAIFTSSSPATLQVLVASNVDDTPCTQKAQCSYLRNLGRDYSYECDTSRGRCAISLQVSAKADFNSLPDFDVSGVLVIIVVSSLLFSAGLGRRR